ncbi:MAG: hypothetical protein DMG65_18760 [Candidatus Angelobacter sp. Gp1-AA117]|nr:MAG: hypothetical protein DMG65_18760 [Candidatus Angelobacter sp. Gp1-AA117]
MRSFRQRLLAGTFAVLVLAIAPAYSQNFSGKSDDTTSSLGSFKIQVATNFQSVVNGCPGYDPTTRIWTSPTMFDGTTLIGRSDVLTDGSPADLNGVPVGSANTVVSENMLSAPPGWPCLGDTPCAAAPGTHEVHTELRKLNLVAFACGGPPPGRPAVRAGTAYSAPIKISSGEVESHAAPGGSPDFPASSFFDMFVQVDLPACGTLPASTVQNNLPLIVKNNHLTAFPPRVIYIHDQSSSVPVVFAPGGPFAGQTLGYLVLAGHGASFTCSQSDQDEFNTFMASQPVGTCPSNACAPPSTGGCSTANGTGKVSNGAVICITPAATAGTNPQ